MCSVLGTEKRPGVSVIPNLRLKRYPVWDQQKATILTLHDNQDNRDTLAQLLRQEGFEVREAASGEQGLRLAAENPDLIILAGHLLDMGGPEVCRRIKAHPATAGIPVLHLSTAALGGRERVDGLPSGADAYLSQPVSPPELLGSVHALLRARQAEQERARLLHELDQERALLHTLLQEAPVGFAFLDRDLRYVRVNDFLSSLHGLPAADHLGRTMAEVLPGLAPYVEPVLRGVLETGAPVLQVEIHDATPRAPGQVRHWLANCYPIATPSGAQLGVAILVTDITEQKQAEAARRREEKLREADRHKDEFLAVLAHELRNPLGPIRNAVQVMRLMEPMGPGLQQAREIIDRQVTHMARLIDDLLDVSRISRGKILLRKERLDLAARVRTSVEDYRKLLEASGLKLVLQVPERPLWVRGDPTRLAQVVGNVLHNASKFTDAGGQVSVAVKPDPDGNAVCITVCDTGIGMEPAMLRQIFETFCQADRNPDRNRSGLGLGLVLVKGLVELHGGEVWAASAGLGQGSEFTIRLPLEAPPGRAQPTATPVVAAERPYRILLIEDNKDTAESMQMLLDLVGHQVQVAYTGVEGLEAARRFLPEIVLCDIGLPGGMDGYAVAQALRQDPVLGSTCLIAMTGYGQEKDKRRARAAGFDAHLTKPVDFLELQQVLASLECLSE